MSTAHNRPRMVAPPEVLFGAYLSALIDDADWAVIDLANALGVSRSLVYKWMRGQRTPNLISGYVERIADVLELAPTARKLLLESQLRSLRAPRPTSSHVPSAVRNLVDFASAAKPLGVRAPPARHSQMDAEAGAVNGVDAVLDAMLAMLERAPDLPPEPQLASEQALAARTILISFQGDLSPTASKSQRWIDALRAVMERGWRVHHVWRLNRDASRSVALAERMLDLLGAHRYFPYYVTRYETLSPPYDLVIVPNRAAMLLFATETPHQPDAALLVRQLDQVALLAAHFAQLQAQSRRLLRSYAGLSYEFGAELVDAETRFGGRSIAKYGLSIATEPTSWSVETSHWALRMKARGIDVAPLIEQRIQRQTAFEENARTFVYRDLCPTTAIERLVNYGRYLINPDGEPMPASPAVRVEHLEQTIHVLRTRKNYSLGLVDDDEQSVVRIKPKMFWEVTGGMRVLINSRVTDAQGKQSMIEVVIAEATIAAAFQQYFDSLWEHLAPVHSDKADVIAYLEHQLAVARDKLAQEE